MVAETAGAAASTLERAYDLNGAVGPTDKIISALPDWRGRLWFVSAGGVVGAVDPVTGAVRSRALGEGIGNSFAVDDTGGVFIVSDAALYRFDADAAGAPASPGASPIRTTAPRSPASPRRARARRRR